MRPDIPIWISLGISALSAGLTAFGVWLQYDQWKQNSSRERSVKPGLNNNHNNSKKVTLAKVFMVTGILFFILNSGFIIHNLIKNDHNSRKSAVGQNAQVDTIKKTEPQLVFAGGGSVRNYLMQSPNFKDEKTGMGIEVGIDTNTISIPMASGSAWRVLAEEYHLKDDDNLKKFTTICLSADEMSEEFYTEYISSLKDAIVIKVDLGEDPLVAYISETVREEYKIDTTFIRLDRLALILQRIIDGKEKINVYTTNIMSGTLEQYKKSFKNSNSVQGLGSKMIDSIAKELHIDTIQDTLMKSLLMNSIETRNFFDLEKMIEERQARPYYDKTNIDSINAPFIILGSKYYCIEGLEGSSFKYSKLPVVDIIDSIETTISKPMNLYFLAYKKKNGANEYEYEVKDHRIIDFLTELESRYPDIVTNPDDRKVWTNMMKTNTIEHYLNNRQKMNKITEIKKQDKK